MLWSAFTCTAANLRNKEPDLFSDWDNDDLIALNKTQAKIDMYYDLQDSLKFEEETDSTFEDILDTHEAKLQEALSARQIYLHYRQMPGSRDSANAVKTNQYEAMYNHYRDGFSFLVKDDGIKIASRRMLR